MGAKSARFSWFKKELLAAISKHLFLVLSLLNAERKMSSGDVSEMSLEAQCGSVFRV